MSKAIGHVLLSLLAASLFAQAAPPFNISSHSTPKSARAARRKTGTPGEDPMLRQELAEQKQQIEQLREEAQRRDAAMREMQQQLSELQSLARRAQSTASATEQNSAALTQVQRTVGGLESSSSSASALLEKTEKRVDQLEHPVQIHYKGITFTPGGFVAAYGIYRAHNTNTDATSSFGSIPFSGSSAAHLSEFRMTARHTNLNLMANATLHGIRTTGYVEMDFEGAAPSANEVQTNSFTPRLREAWFNAETKSGWSFLGGQAWELLTPNRKGIAPKTEARPATIDASYLVGFHYARETVFRLTKKVDDEFTFAAAVENPERVIQGTEGLSQCGTTVPCLVPPVGTSSNFGNVNTSTDVAPDVAAKIAVDPGWGHFEFGGMARFFRSRVVTIAGVPVGGTNDTNLGGGLSFNAGLPLIPHKLDFYINTIAGRGIGRFLPGGGVDVVVKPDGTLMPVKGAGIMAGFSSHLSPDWDFNLYAGTEYYGRTVYGTTGYGVPTANQTGCNVEVLLPAEGCSAVNRDIWEVTPVLWHRFWKGKEGSLAWGLQYEYIHRRPWQGNVANTPVGIQNAFLTAMRWYVP